MNMNLGKLIEQFGSDDRCREYLISLRWPEGIRCPRCGFAKVSRIGWTDKPDPSKPGQMKKGRRQLDCNSCRYRFSVTTGTVFHDSHLPLWKWFAATYIMAESKKGISAHQLMRMLGIGSYRTAWYLTHRIRSAMWQSYAEMLGDERGTVELDETYVGGKYRRGSGPQRPKSMVLGAIERGGDVRIKVYGKAHSPDGATLRGWASAAVSDDAASLYTDGHLGYRGIGDEDTVHEWVDHSIEEWVRGDVSTQNIESAWSLLKRSIVGSYHQLSAKHLQAYMDEFSFRFNNRENPYLFRDTLVRLIQADALTYAALTE